MWAGEDSALGWWGRSRTKFPCFGIPLDNGSCWTTAVTSLSRSLCPALCPDRWSPLRGICWSLRQHYSGFSRAKTQLQISPTPLPAGNSGCLRQILCFTLLIWLPVSYRFAHLWMLRCSNLSDMLVCRLGVICGVVDIVISREEFWGHRSHHHTSDIQSCDFF